MPPGRPARGAGRTLSRGGTFSAESAEIGVFGVQSNNRLRPAGLLTVVLIATPPD